MRRNRFPYNMGRNRFPYMRRRNPMMMSMGLFSIIGFFCSFSRPLANWFKTSHCPKCGAWHCLQLHSEVVKDKTYGHSQNRYGNYRSFYGRTNADPFIREWIEQRYICTKCGRHVAVEITRDRY